MTCCNHNFDAIMVANMTRFLITGVSSGIGRELVKELIKHGNGVWGIARRVSLLASLKEELKETEKFHYSDIDVTKQKTWIKIIAQMKSAKFSPQVVIFNAAILDNDLHTEKAINVGLTKKIIETNFLSIINGLNELFGYVKPGTQFIFIGSSSAFKGCGEEGIGYCVSKAALSQTMESLHLRYNGQYVFKIVHFGPIRTSMVPFKAKVLFMRSPQQAANVIIQAVNSNRHIFYYPLMLFLFLRFIKLLPSPVYLSILKFIDSFHKKHQNRNQ